MLNESEKKLQKVMEELELLPLVDAVLQKKIDGLKAQVSHSLSAGHFEKVEQDLLDSALGEAISHFELKHPDIAQRLTETRDELSSKYPEFEMPSRH